MPTLIRFAVVLLVLAGLVFGAMAALALVVTPTQKEVRVRIAPSELGVQPTTGADPLGIRPQAPIIAPEPEPEIDAEPEPEPTAEPQFSEPDADGTRTVELPPE